MKDTPDTTPHTPDPPPPVHKDYTLENTVSAGRAAPLCRVPDAQRVTRIDAIGIEQSGPGLATITTADGRAFELNASGVAAEKLVEIFSGVTTLADMGGFVPYQDNPQNVARRMKQEDEPVPPIKKAESEAEDEAAKLKREAAWLGQEAEEPVVVKGVAADGTAYALGELVVSATIFNVKQKLSTMSEMSTSCQSLYLVEDVREEQDDLELKNHETLREVRKHAGDTQELEIAIMVGLSDDVAEFLKAIEADVSGVPDNYLKDNGSNANLSAPFAVAFVPMHPDLLVVSEHAGNDVCIYHQQRQERLCSREAQDSCDLFGPWGVTVTSDAEYVLVTEQKQNRVQMLKLVVAPDSSAASLEFVRYIGVKQSLKLPNGVTTRQAGTQETVLVSDGANHRVLEFSLDGSFIRTIGSEEELNFPSAVAVLPSTGAIIVAEYQSHQIAIFDGESGELIRKFGSEGKKDGLLSRPGGLAADAHDNILVLDNGTGRLQAFTVMGEHLCTRDDLGIYRSDVKGIAWNAESSCLAIANGYSNTALVFFS
jgi:hypothetical protein